MGRLVIHGTSVYEIDEQCERRKKRIRKEPAAASREPAGQKHRPS